MKPTWKKYLLYASAIIIVGGLIFGLIRLILQGYTVAWTGFGDYTPPNSDLVRGKTLWDWLELSVIPFVLAGGALYLQRSERAVERKAAEDRAKLERELATDRQQEAALQAYLDRMADLLLRENLRTTENEEVRKVARIRTLTVLRGLDAKRKRMVLLFLYESGLISDNPVIDLSGADLTRVDLRETRLKGANLKQADLRQADLEGAFLWAADFIGANLMGANLRETKLMEAKLIGANLSKADLYQSYLVQANLMAANLEASNLSHADLTHADLRHASLIKANGWTARLVEADISLADLSEANLRRADLCETNLYRTNLTQTDLSEALINGANLAEAVLDKAKVSEKQLATAKSLVGATMPDGTIHD